MRTLALLIALACCAGAWAQSAPGAAIPQIKRPLGPLPGPAEDEARAKSPYADDRVALMEGRKLFVQYNCAGCHGGHAGGGMGPSLRDESWIYGSKAGEIYDSIAEGRAHGMPAWGPLLPREQIWKLVAYIKTLRTPQEPQPPK